ncbi:hypothetical protein C9J22_07650 [Photobacterium phosphoreum]|uniref:hypothetical protein n=1 Tax=Photobacterium phosphoreum TaxID=659 RepID=UPI000D17711F|nr:hypothetical protein [Photobacterium phosphoreum]PSU71102.1 hypothetical protein C9J22_07650 [Photobacterium phosphoreum]
MVSILKRICDHFDSSKLTKDLTFVSIGVIGIVISGMSTAAISNSFNGELILCDTPQCFDNLLSWFSFPLKALTATAAIMGIVAMVHRSKQTANQIELSIKQVQTTLNQNIYSNYSAHIKDFKGHISSISFKVIKPYNLTLLYEVIFPDNNPSSFNYQGLPLTEDIILNHQKYLISDEDIIGISNNDINVIEKSILFINQFNLITNNSLQKIGFDIKKITKKNGMILNTKYKLPLDSIYYTNLFSDINKLCDACNCLSSNSDKKSISKYIALCDHLRQAHLSIISYKPNT